MKFGVRVLTISFFFALSKELFPLKFEILSLSVLAAKDLCLSLHFLDAPSHLYKRSCPSVRPSVGPSVGPSVRPSRVIFKGEKYAY